MTKHVEFCWGENIGIYGTFTLFACTMGMVPFLASIGIYFMSIGKGRVQALCMYIEMEGNINYKYSQTKKIVNICGIYIS